MCDKDSALPLSLNTSILFDYFLTRRLKVFTNNKKTKAISHISIICGILNARIKMRIQNFLNAGSISGSFHHQAIKDMTLISTVL
jgi:hypothetical protein